MLALTITEPWATLVALGEKRIETRSWHTDYRGPVAIHAAKGMTRQDVDIALDEACDRVLERHRFKVFGDGRSVGPIELAFRATRGKVIATARLIACCQMVVGPDDWTICVMDYRREGEAAYRPIPESELPFGHFAEGRFAWILADVQRLAEPIPARGQLGLWEWTAPAELRLAS